MVINNGARTNTRKAESFDDLGLPCMTCRRNPLNVKLTKTDRIVRKKLS